MIWSTPGPASGPSNPADPSIPRTNDQLKGQADRRSGTGSHPGTRAGSARPPQGSSRPGVQPAGDHTRAHPCESSRLMREFILSSSAHVRAGHAQADSHFKDARPHLVRPWTSAPVQGYPTAVGGGPHRTRREDRHRDRVQRTLQRLDQNLHRPPTVRRDRRPTHLRRHHHRNRHHQLPPRPHPRRWGQLKPPWWGQVELTYSR